MEKKIFHREMKRQLLDEEYLTVRNRLLAVARPDTYSGLNGTYQLRTLYFDTETDQAFKTRHSGFNYEGYRIRYYNYDASLVKVEKKTRMGTLVLKKTTEITREQCSDLLRGEYDWMTDMDDALLTELYAKLKEHILLPRAIVDCIREAYVYIPENIRISIDQEIHTPLKANEFFTKATLTPDQADGMILEMKYGNDIPKVLKDIWNASEEAEGILFTANSYA